MTPRATYRLQFRKEFGFDAAAELAPYLARLGVSHVYASSYLKARPGSTHGYDIVAHGELNPELGDAAAFARMQAAFRTHELGEILDFVPNHMGVGGADNPRWLNVLEWGPSSEAAGWFDIDWEPDRRDLHDKVLVPFLGDQYGLELERGRLTLTFDAEAGEFAVWAYGVHKLPVCPLHYDRILGDADADLARLADAFAGLPAWRPQIERRARSLKAELANLVREKAPARAALYAQVARFNGKEDDFDSWLGLHALIRDQFWRPAHFRVAGDDINYRRFFNINDLAGLRMELPDVFDETHRLVFALLADGSLDGLRIDHIDGLHDPKGYLQRLREKAPRRDFYLVVEKILAGHETVPGDWPVEGTTGYEFANLVLGFLLDPAGADALTAAYEQFTGITRPFAEILRDSKLRIMENEMASELNVLARDAARTARQNPRTADFTRNILHRALKEVIAAFPVYRTYIDANGTPTEADRRDLDWAIAQARRTETTIDPSVFDFVHALLSGDLVAHPHSGFSRQSVLRCAMKLQQYSGPVMAKSLEDTAFYRYNRFIALNEVGGSPLEIGIGLAAFHRANKQRRERWPAAMITTATHDTKRGEDARARLAVLAEIPEEWARAVQVWSRLIRARRGDVEGTAPPHRNDEYLFYQTLLGSWPMEMLDGLGDRNVLADFTTRVQATMIKAVREAKQHSSWGTPDQAYEEAITTFVTDALDVARPAFMEEFLPFARRVAGFGVHNSLVQTLLKFTAPGMPDIYQGGELWDLSMVDPDNRRTVDYALRLRLLEDIGHDLAHDPAAAFAGYLKAWHDGRVKLAAIATLLGYRRTHAALFASGDYAPLDAEGPDFDRICAYRRAHEGDAFIAVAARFPARTAEQPFSDDTALPLPSGSWKDLFTGHTFAGDAAVSARKIFRILPVAALIYSSP